MTPKVRALFERCSGKGWVLVAISDGIYLDDQGFRCIPQCEKCGVHIRWIHTCVHYLAPGETIHVGSECVKSLVDDQHLAESIAFVRQKWRQRRTYFWKRHADGVFIVGPRDDGAWWVAIGDRLTGFDRNWTFGSGHFPSAVQAQDYIHSCVLNRTPIDRPRPRPASAHSGPRVSANAWDQLKAIASQLAAEGPFK